MAPANNFVGLQNFILLYTTLYYFKDFTLLCITLCYYLTISYLFILLYTIWFYTKRLLSITIIIIIINNYLFNWNRTGLFSVITQ